MTFMNTVGNFRRASFLNSNLIANNAKPTFPLTHCSANTAEDKEVATFFQPNRRHSLAINTTFPQFDFEEEKQWSDVLTALSPKTLPTEVSLEQTEREFGMEEFMNYNFNLNMSHNMQHLQNQANMLLQQPVPQDFGVLGKKRKAIDAGIKLELEPNDFVDEIRKGSVYKKGKKSRLQALSRKTPAFVVEEINSTTGKGEFKNTELAVMLFYAYKYFEDFDVYSKVRACMSFKRSRASIRRKVEKLVFYETKIKGGLLGDEETRITSQNVCLRKFWEMTDYLVTSGESEEVLFSRRLQEEALSMGFFRPDSKIKLF